MSEVGQTSRTKIWLPACFRELQAHPGSYEIAQSTPSRNRWARSGLGWNVPGLHPGCATVWGLGWWRKSVAGQCFALGDLGKTIFFHRKNVVFTGNSHLLQNC